jgi:hypothetical protein
MPCSWCDSDIVFPTKTTACSTVTTCAVLAVATAAGANSNNTN